MENLMKALLALIDKATEYLEVSTELKRRELEQEVPVKTKPGFEVPATPKELPCKEPPKAKTVEPKKPVEAETAEPPVEPEAPEVHPKYVNSEEAAKILGCTASAVSIHARRGYIPYRNVNKREREFPLALLEKYKSLAAFRNDAAQNRGNNNKEHRWRSCDFLYAPGICKGYMQAISDNAHNLRLFNARHAGVLNVYTLMGVEYVNLDEAIRFADWWDLERQSKDKLETADFHNAADRFCVHINDLIWVYTRDWNAQFQPTGEQMAEFLAMTDKLHEKLPSIQVDGIRYYKKDAIKIVEKMRDLLSHVEKKEA